MEEGNYQATHMILYLLSPLLNICQVGTPLVSTGHSTWLQDPWIRISPKCFFEQRALGACACWPGESQLPAVVGREMMVSC